MLYCKTCQDFTVEHTNYQIFYCNKCKKQCQIDIIIDQNDNILENDEKVKENFQLEVCENYY